MIVALAQTNPVVGDIAGNCEKIRSIVAQAAAARANLVIFPELAVCGYPPKDLVLKPKFVEANEKAVEELAASAANGPALLVGHVRRNTAPVGRSLRNALALLSGGRVADIFHKSLLPTYDVFDEHRYFEPAERAGVATLDVAGRPIRLGVTICEDLWNDKRIFERPLYHRNPIDELKTAGAEIIVNASASPFVVDKQAFRERLLGSQAAATGLPVIVVNQVGGNDELIFDGASCVFDADGRLAARAKAFEEDLLLIDLVQPGDARCERYPEALESVWQALILGTRDYVRKCGFSDVVIGLSGGVDSALTAVLAVEALSPRQVHGIAMPSRYSSDHSLRDAEALAKNFGIDYRVVSIEGMHRAFEKDLTPLYGGRPPDTTEENVQARIRGNILMSLSNKFGWLLLTTGNKSELAVGYCTLYGDMCGGLAVISDVPKTMVYELARLYNRGAGRAVIPESSLTKVPSAELRPDQHDQQTLPPYDVLDAILHQYIEQEKSADEIIAAGFDPAIVRDIARKVDQNEYKRKQAATGLKVTSRAFGVGRRMPIAARFS
ncbi:MAG TPA: NAD+ synthase [Phycisphaerae bacterium]|nr:NAD+ synthase [Phycisphaerae bacterium]